MQYSSAAALAGVFIVVALFAVLFLQNAYVRQRLGDIETTSMSARKASCPDVDNAVRAYALRIATVRMTQLNSGARRPRIPREAFSQAVCGISKNNRRRGQMSNRRSQPPDMGYWLVLRRTSTSSQLQQDVETSRTQYLILSNAVVRVFPVTLSKYFSELETGNLAPAYVVLGLAGAVSSDAQRCGVAQFILPPWINPSADGVGVMNAMEPAAATMLPVGMLLDVVSALSTAPSSAARAPRELLKDRTIHLWGYGRATSDS